MVNLYQFIGILMFLFTTIYSIYVVTDGFHVWDREALGHILIALGVNLYFFVSGWLIFK